VYRVRTEQRFAVVCRRRKDWVEVLSWREILREIFEDWEGILPQQRRRLRVLIKLENRGEKRLRVKARPEVQVVRREDDVVCQ
jgi:hypothetical protein